MIDQNRLAALETRLGLNLPSDLLSTLESREPIREGNVALITPDRIWDLRSTFGLEPGGVADQLDSVYRLVGDVMPEGALPFAQDWGGNFYCLMLSGPLAGQIVYWDHERDADDNDIVPVARSLDEFYERLVPDPRDDD